MITRIAVCCAAFAAIAFWTARPSVRPAPGVAFAAVKRAMAQVPFYHVRFRVWNAGDEMPEARPAPDAWEVEGDQWFDALRGFAMQTRVRELEEENAGPVRVLLQPDGQMWTRADDVLVRMKLPVRPEDLRGAAGAAEPMTDPLKAVQSAGKPDASYAVRVAGVAPGAWKGRPARVFTIERTPRPAAAAKGLPHQRALVYVDGATQRVLAWQMFSRWAARPGWGEVPAVELEYDYDEAPAPSVFDPEALKRGASEVMDVETPQGMPSPTPTP